METIELQIQDYQAALGLCLHLDVGIKIEELQTLQARLVFKMLQTKNDEVLTKIIDLTGFLLIEADDLITLDKLLNTIEHQTLISREAEKKRLVAKIKSNENLLEKVETSDSRFVIVRKVQSLVIVSVYQVAVIPIIT